LVTAEISLNYKNFEKLEKICSGGEPVRPISLYLKIAKRREIKNGEIIIGNEDFTVDIFDISWRRPLF
jgi:ASC-1-like (ASCH) protein